MLKKYKNVEKVTKMLKKYKNDEKSSKNVEKKGPKMLKFENVRRHTQFVASVRRA